MLLQVPPLNTVVPLDVWFLPWLPTYLRSFVSMQNAIAFPPTFSPRLSLLQLWSFTCPLSLSRTTFYTSPLPPLTLLLYALAPAITPIAH